MEVGRDAETWRQAAALLLVFALLGTAIWALRRRVGGIRTGASKSLRTIERIALTPQHAVHLIRAPGRELLVITHPQGCSLLFEQLLLEQALSEQPCHPSQAAGSAHLAHPAVVPEQNTAGRKISSQRQGIA